MILLAVNPLTLTSQAFAESDALGKLIFAALFSLSIFCWYILLTKFYHLKKIGQESRQLGKSILSKKERLLDLSSDQIKRGLPFGSLYESVKIKTVKVLEKNHYFSQGETVFLSRSDMELIESSLNNSIGNEVKKLENNLFILSTIATLAPFLGLLGTVWGISITFSELQRGASATSNQVILGGLATALATTVLGLLIAIPALIGYNYFKNSIKYFVAEMEDFGSELLTTVELQYRKVEA